MTSNHQTPWHPLGIIKNANDRIFALDIVKSISNSNFANPLLKATCFIEVQCADFAPNLKIDIPKYPTRLVHEQCCKVAGLQSHRLSKQSRNHTKRTNQSNSQLVSLISYRQLLSANFLLHPSIL